MKPELQTNMLVAVREIDALARRASRRIGINPVGARDAYSGWEWTNQVHTPLGPTAVRAILTADPDQFNEALLIQVCASAYPSERREIGWSQTYLTEPLGLETRRSRFPRGLKARVSRAIQQAWQDANRNAGRLEELATQRQQLITSLTEQRLYSQ